MDLFRKAYEAGSPGARAYHYRHRDRLTVFLREYPAYRELTRVRD